MEQARLQWACRRGMLELDLILKNFLDQHYAELSSVQQKSFEELLLEHDVELAEWLLTEKTPPSDFQEIIVIIKKYVHGFV